MKRIYNNLFIRTTLIIAVAIISLAAINPMAHAAPATVDLGTAEPFAILSGTPNITDAGNASVINGDVGLSPATGAGIGLTCAQVTGTIYSVDAAGPLPCRVTNAPLLVTAKNDLTTAYTDASGRTPVTTVATELGGTTVIPGVYDSVSTTFEITAGAGALTLDGQNDSTSVFIFNMDFDGTGLTVGSASTVSLINEAQACNVFWRVNTAAINTTANFIGTILALNSITVADGATIEGRLLARNGNVTLINDTITVPVCLGATSEVTPSFPNTGSSTDNNSTWMIVAGLGVLVGAAITYYARKKHVV